MKDELAHILRQTEESYRGIHPGVETKQKGWEKWYAQWLLTLVDLESILGILPTQPTLEKLLLHCNRQFEAQALTDNWAQYMAKRIIEIVAKNSKSSNHQPNT